MKDCWRFGTEIGRLQKKATHLTWEIIRLQKRLALNNQLSPLYLDDGARVIATSKVLKKLKEGHQER